jgi:O-antigen/teichoic acid export membrane protein
MRPRDSRPDRSHASSEGIEDPSSPVGEEIPAAGRQQLATLLIRGGMVGSKLLLLYYLARYLSLADVGTYSIFLTSVTIAVYLLGGEFHAFSIRELLAAPESRRGTLARYQMAFYGASYIVVLPMLAVVFAAGWLPWRTAGWFFGIAVGSHLTQELHRLILMVLRRSVAAYAVLFLSQSAWIFVVVPLGVYAPRFRALDPVFFGWALGSTVSLLAGWAVLSAGGLPDCSSWKIDWAWLGRGAQVSARFLAMALCQRLIDYADRYFIKTYRTAEELGVYSLYSSIVNLAQEGVFLTVVVRIVPSLVSSAGRGDEARLRRAEAVLARDIRWVLLLGIAALVAAPYVLFPLLHREELFLQISAYWILLAGAAVLCLSFVPHWVLYARGRDNRILLAISLGAATNLLLNYLWIRRFGLVGAASATAVALALVAVLKAAFARGASRSAEGQRG